jgi:hypothetical protein
MKLNFIYDLKKDIENHEIIYYTKLKGGESKVLNAFFDKFGDIFNKDNLQRFITNILISNKIEVDKQIIHFQQSWNKIEEKFFNKMEEIFLIHPPFKKIKVYLTTNDRCSYSLKDGYFFITIFTKNPKRIIMHELFHFYTYYAFKKELNSFDKAISYDIKESLVEILNLECYDLLDALDKGYERHKKLREMVRDSWQRTKNIKTVFVELKKLL